MFNYLKRNNLMWGRMIIDPALFLLIFGEKKKPRAVRFSIHCFSPSNFISFISHIKMVKQRVKKRTHQKPQNASVVKGSAASMSKTPKSMVIRVGASQVGSSVTQLVKDVRRMMEPDTAVRLKV